MGEVRDPGFSILPHTNSSFKDGVAYERKRIIDILEEELADELYKAIVIGLIVKDRGNIPKRFRDISNGE